MNQTKQGELEIITKKKSRLQLATGNAYTQENKTRVEGHLRTLSVVKEKQGYIRQTYPNQVETSAYKPYSWKLIESSVQYQNNILETKSEKTEHGRLQKGIWDDRVYIMDREHQQEQVEAGSWCGKPGSGSSSAIRWSNPFAVDPIAASWHIVLLEAWLFTVGGLAYLLLVIKVHSARSSKNILQSRARLFR
ncbi:hypothetical protein F4703DRAFT_1921588 [Phycomyces blakesleeanus]